MTISADSHQAYGTEGQQHASSFANFLHFIIYFTLAFLVEQNEHHSVFALNQDHWLTFRVFLSGVTAKSKFAPTVFYIQ